MTQEGTIRLRSCNLPVWAHGQRPIENRFLNKVQTIVRTLAEAVEPDNEEGMSISEQCRILGIHRSTYYYRPKERDTSNEVAILRAILVVLGDIPFYGYRKVTLELKRDGWNVTRKQVRRIMHQAGLRAIYPGKRISVPNKLHPVYPYILRDKKIWLPNQVWATDITYVKLKGSHVYLVAILDFFSRRVLSWKLSNTIDTAFCVAAPEETIAVWGTPSIFNTDQGSQFTATAFIEVFKSHGIQISNGRC